MSYNVKSIRQDFKSKGVFYSPEDVALMLKSFVGEGSDPVYDPTCGDGALLAVFPPEVKKYGQEINEHQLQVAVERLENFHGEVGDTLKSPAFMDKKFRRIVANPPFSVRWEPPINGLFADERFSPAPAMPPKSKADFAFLLHILHYLAEDGVAAVLSFPGVLYRGNAEGKIREWLVQENVIDKVIKIPGKKFVDTTIETAVIVLRKNRNTEEIEFVDTELEKSVSVPRIEVLERGGGLLSVNTYCFQLEEKPPVDPVALQAEARRAMIAALRKDIEVDRMVCKIEGWTTHEEYLEELRVVIGEYM